MSEDQELNTNNNKLWSWLLIAIPTLFVIVGVIILAISYSDNVNDNPGNESTDQTAIEYAKRFHFRADIHIDVSVLKVVVSADTSTGPDNLYLDLRKNTGSNIFHHVRLFNSGNNVYRGTLPDNVEYGEWQISLYPENQLPAWRIDDVSIFPNNIVSIAAK